MESTLTPLGYNIWSWDVSWWQVSKKESVFLLFLSAKPEENDTQTAENINLALDFMLIRNERLKAGT